VWLTGGIGARDAGRRDAAWLTGGIGVRRGPMSVAECRRERNGAGTWTSMGGSRRRVGPGFKWIQNISNSIQTRPNLIWFKQDLPLLENFEIKYSFEVSDGRINFPYRNFLRFWMNFWTKIQRSFDELETRKNWLKILENLEFDEIWPAVFLFQLIERKNKFLAKADQKFEFLLKEKFGLVSQ
jgi:hypothetical protein